MNSHDIVDVEYRVMDMLLAGDNECLSILRGQLNGISVLSRDLSGKGFYTKYLIAPGLDRLKNYPTFKLGDVNGSARNVAYGLGFLLYIAGGAISMLEGYTYGEPWPKKLENLTLSYSDGGPRDMGKIREILRPSKG